MADVDPRVRAIGESWNPDCMMRGEIEKLKLRLRDLRNEGVDCMGLYGYAQNKAWAMRCREEGNIPAALRYEQKCDEIYDELPDWARW